MSHIDTLRITQGDIPAQLEKYDTVRVLQIEHLPITADVWSAICRIKGIEELHLRSCCISAQPKTIKNFKSLQKLDLQQSKLKRISARFLQIKTLETINFMGSTVESLPTKKLRFHSRELVLNLLNCKSLPTISIKPIRDNENLTILRA